MTSSFVDDFDSSIRRFLPAIVNILDCMKSWYRWGMQPMGGTRTVVYDTVYL